MSLKYEPTSVTISPRFSVFAENSSLFDTHSIAKSGVLQSAVMHKAKVVMVEEDVGPSHSPGALNHFTET